MAIKKRTVLKVILIVLSVIFISLALFWELALEPWLLISKTRHGNMLKLSWEIMYFDYKERKMPESLEEMVEKGYLPEKSTLYSCPMKHHTLRDKKISYKDVEYEFSFTPNEIVIRIPEEVFSNKRFNYYAKTPSTSLRELKIEHSTTREICD